MGLRTRSGLFDKLVWLDGRPLLDTDRGITACDLFSTVLWTFDPHGRPRYNMALVGRGKKNNKTTDLILACLYRFLAWPSDSGNDAFILASDEGQAGDDLSLAKKMIAVNPILAAEVVVNAKVISNT